jgi:hypothetical protein
MSSQGGNATTITPGYPFQQAMVRDASDWISSLKQRIIRQEAPSSTSFPKDPWIPFGNDRRLNYLQGGYKRYAFDSTCSTCPRGAFNGNGNAYT